jgi:excisionase family DNA binding protein
MSTTPLPILVSVTSAARMLDCKPDKIRSMIKRGKLTRVDVDGMVRIPRAEIEALLPCQQPIDSGSTEASGAPSADTDATRRVSRSVLRQQRAIGRMGYGKSRGSTAA